MADLDTCENFLYVFKAAPRGRSRRRHGAQAVTPAATPATAGPTPVGWRERRETFGPPLTGSSYRELSRGGVHAPAAELSKAGQNPSRPSVTAGQPHPSNCLVEVHAKTTLTEPARPRRWQRSEAWTRVAQWWLPWVPLFTPGSLVRPRRSDSTRATFAYLRYAAEDLLAAVNLRSGARGRALGLGHRSPDAVVRGVQRPKITRGTRSSISPRTRSGTSRLVNGWVTPTGRLGASETTARATATTAGWSAVWTVTMLIICTVVCALTLLAILADADHSRPGRYNADVEAVRTVLTCKRQGAREATRQVTSTTHSKNDRLGRTGSDSRYGEAGVCLLAARYAERCRSTRHRMHECWRATRGL